MGKTIHKLRRPNKTGQKFRLRPTEDSRAKGRGEDNKYIFQTSGGGLSWEDVSLSRHQAWLLLCAGQRVLQFEQLFEPARELGEKHGSHFLPELISLWEHNFGKKKTTDWMSLSVEFFSRRKRRGESVGEFCADKIHMATKLREDLFTTDAVFEKAVFCGDSDVFERRF